jgi:RHS repeat-associated protein
LPESGTTTFGYDSAGRLTTKTDARNITTTTSYDNINRVTSKSYSDGTPTVTLGYDANGFTRLKTSMTDGLGNVTYAYDNMDRPTQESRTLSGVSGTFTTGYGYNIKGDLTSMTYPSGRVVNFNYATGGGCCNSRLASVVDGTTNTILNSSMNFDSAGDLLNATLGNGVVQVFTYNNRLQQTGITSSLNGTSLMNFTYNYGTNTINTGRVLSRTDSIQPEHSENYFYDSIYRLDTVVGADSTGSWGIAWTFDVWGNRVAQTPLGLATSKIGTQTIGYTNNRNIVNTYDAAGNTTNDGLHNYTFNAENQIVSMDGGVATYTYDGDGKRMKKVTSIETTFTFYGPSGIISEFTTSSGIATATGASGTDRCLYRTTDKLGSTMLSLTANGTVIENNHTLPYGEMWLAADNGQPSTNDKKFTTYQRDTESGLDYAMNRYDSNVSGRFMSVDLGKWIVTRPQSLNRYVYTHNDPVNYFDPKGSRECFPANDMALEESDCGDGGDGGICDDSIAQLLGGPCVEIGIGVVVVVVGTTGPAQTKCHNETCMPAALNQVWNDLQKPGCKDVFKGGIKKGFDPWTVLNDIVTGKKHGSLGYDLLPGIGLLAQTQGFQNAFGFKKVVITINDTSASLGGPYWNAGDANVNAEILLHELGHAFNDLFGDGSSTLVPDTNPDGTPNAAAEEQNHKALSKCLN